MNNNLPSVKKENIFSKISNFFKNLFSKNKSENIENAGNNVNENIVNTTSDKFMNDLKNKVLEDKNILDNMDKVRLIKEIENNTELLENLSIEKLEEIDKYYDEIIEEYKKKLLDDNNYYYRKNNDTDVIWWIENPDRMGEHLFTFDKKKIFNLFRDYPHELTPEQKEIFDKENPYWADFFKDRK